MNENLPKLHFIAKTASRVSLIILLALTMFYFYWMRFSIPLIFYVDNYRESAQIGGYVLFVLYIFTISISMSILDDRFQISGTGLLRIGLFLFATLLCCLSANASIHLPTTLDKVVLNDKTYYLTGELEEFDILAYHRLYECANSYVHCKPTPFWEGGGASFRPLSLMTDSSDNKNEINVLYTYSDGTSKLIYTYGNPNREYDGEPVQLGNRLYYLAYYRNSESIARTYTLYQCQLDNNNCNRLPVEYEGDGRYADLQVDETTDEVRLFFHSDFDPVRMKYTDEILIFSYGEIPRCYVKGCKVIERLQ